MMYIYLCDPQVGSPIRQIAFCQDGTAGPVSTQRLQSIHLLHIAPREPATFHVSDISSESYPRLECFDGGPPPPSPNRTDDARLLAVQL